MTAVELTRPARAAADRHRGVGGRRQEHPDRAAAARHRESCRRITSTTSPRGGRAGPRRAVTDGLRAEREQGITIDVAYRFFSTDAGSFILADTPGHERYTRNMFTGASTADVAIVLIDARSGVAHPDPPARAHRRAAGNRAHRDVRQQDGPRRTLSGRATRSGRRTSRPTPPGTTGTSTSPTTEVGASRRHRRRAHRADALVRRPGAARAARGDRAARRPPAGEARATSRAMGDPPRGRAPIHRGHLRPECEPRAADRRGWWRCCPRRPALGSLGSTPTTAPLDEAMAPKSHTLRHEDELDTPATT